MEKIRACIVGCGRIATLNVMGYRDNTDAEIYAVCDRNAEKARQAACEWGAEKVYTDYTDVLADEKVDMIELLVPHHLHCQMTVQACRAGKHVSVQKPMAMTLKEADEMIQAAKEAGVMLKVYENFVFYPPYVKAKELIDSGVIGEPVTMRYKMNAGSQKLGWHVDEATWRWRMQEETCGGGPLVFDDGYHKFSVARYLMGDVEKVTAWIDRTEVIPGEFYEDAPAMIMWKYKNAKKYGFLDITYSEDLFINTDYYSCDERVEVTGTKGVLWVTRCTAKMLQIPSVIVYRDGQTTSYECMRDDWSDSFVDSTRDFIDAVKNGRPPRLTGEDGREVLRFVLAAMESSQKDRAVYLDELEGE
jgi:predicted dehydrogenase